MTAQKVLLLRKGAEGVNITLIAEYRLDKFLPSSKLGIENGYSSKALKISGISEDILVSS